MYSKLSFEVWWISNLELPEMCEKCKKQDFGRQTAYITIIVFISYVHVYVYVLFIMIACMWKLETNENWKGRESNKGLNPGQSQGSMSQVAEMVRVPE